MNWFGRLSVFLAVGLGTVTMAVAQTQSLTKGVARTNLQAAANGSLNFSLVVPAGATQLSFALSGGTGDADLYVRRSTAPTTTTYDCTSRNTGNTERCAFASPSAATYFVRVFGYRAFSGVQLVADYTAAPAAPTLLQNGASVANLSAPAGGWLRYRIEVPSNATNLQVTTSGGTGALDLYVRRGAEPTASAFDCRPLVVGNNESCAFAQPQAGSYFISLFGYQAFSGATLKVSYTVPSTPPGGGSTWTGFETYYAGAIGKTGTALRAALNEASGRNHRRLSYAEVWEALKYTDEDPANTNNVILIYTGRSQAKTANASTNSSDQDAWNREHVWPKSRGFPNEPQWGYTDVHHLRPADVSVNSTRGNKDFDWGGSPIGEAPGNLTDADSFEPRAAVKGDLARMIFYMAIRYEGNDATGVGDLEISNTVGTQGNFMGKLCTLVAWHRQDAVSADEVRRHSRIFERQGNRNPFVDYPAWAEQLFGASCP
jgi:serine protease